MKRQGFIVLSILFLVLTGAGMGWAQQKGMIELDTVAEMEKEVINSKGKKERRRGPVTTAVPGDVVIYTLYYTNKGQEPADNVVIIDPIPEHMVYVQGSASGADTVITFSMDKGETYNLPEKLTITSANGFVRPARPSEYTHIRWTRQTSLPAGQKGQVSFRARLE
jgi:uncharacterized repeat protein (TIGR01451 family)